MANLSVPEDQKEEKKIPKICGVAGCTNDANIIIKYKDVARCCKHYQEDVDRWGKHNKRGSATRSIMQMMERHGAEYQKVKSGDHLMKILGSLYGSGRSAE